MGELQKTSKFNLKDHWTTKLLLATVTFGVVGELLGKLAGIAVPFAQLFFPLAYGLIGLRVLVVFIRWRGSSAQKIGPCL